MRLIRVLYAFNTRSLYSRKEVFTLNYYYNNIIFIIILYYIIIILAILYALLSSLAYLLILFLMNFKGFSSVFYTTFILIATLYNKLLISKKV